MNTIQEALHALRRPNNTQKKVTITERKQRVFIDLFDQVLSSLCDSGANSAYATLGKLNGKGHYDVMDIDITESKPGYTPIKVVNDDLSWAKYIAETYELTTREIPGNRYRESALVLYVPENAPAREDLFAKNRDKELVGAVSEKCECTDKEIKEDFTSTLPVTPLSHDIVYDFIANVPVATATRPPVFFPVGYFTEFDDKKIPSRYRGGRGSEGQPRVRVVKCTEMTVYTGADYENLQATKDMRKETGKERSGERTGFNFNSENALSNKIGISARGEEMLQCYIRKGTFPKTKYWVSIDDGDLVETSKQEVAQYLTPASANAILNAKEKDGANIVRLRLSGIYKIGNHGSSVV